MSDARNDYWQAGTAVTFVVDDKTDFQANYFFYRANNFINNDGVSMPYGTSAQDHAVNAAFIRSFSKAVRGTRTLVKVTSVVPMACCPRVGILLASIPGVLVSIMSVLMPICFLAPVLVRSATKA